jgi:hypothetical protein
MKKNLLAGVFIAIREEALLDGEAFDIGDVAFQKI